MQLPRPEDVDLATKHIEDLKRLARAMITAGDPLMGSLLLSICGVAYAGKLPDYFDYALPFFEKTLLEAKQEQEIADVTELDL